MGTSAGHVLTIANSIIGVSVLAMPFCFKQCGIVLSTLLLLVSGIMTRLACHYLLKAAITARRRNFEFLAFHIFGPSGKLFVELGIIGFMLGTCIAFFVVMGDLGPAIIGPAFNIDSFSTLRPSVLMGLGLLVVLPLGLLKNVDSLSAVCAASIAFYLCLVLKVMAEATTHLLSWDWIDKVNLWRPAGIPQCLPIFSMALSCQTQLFEIFDSVPNTSLEKMNTVIKSAINICTAVYISVGLFGYIAYCTQNFSGNLLMSFSPTMTSDIIKLGFVLSVAVSFPLVIFPCRASLHSLLFRRGHTPHHELLSGGGNYIPEPRFKCLTIFIVMFSLGTGLLIPSIEVVLGLVGSTIGIMICIMFPAVTFMCISNKNNNERLVAQGLFAIGFTVMILGTYSNLYATEEALSKPAVEIPKAVPPAIKPPSNVVDLPPEISNIAKDKPNILNDKLVGILPDVVKEINTPLPIEVKKDVDILVPEQIPEEIDSNKRKEPPIPVAPGDTVVKEGKALPPLPSDLTENKDKKIDIQIDKAVKNLNEPEPVSVVKKDETISNDVQKKNEELFEKLSKHEAEQKKIIQEQKAILEEFKKQNQQKQNNVIDQDNKSNAANKVQNNFIVDDKLVNSPEKEKQIDLPVVNRVKLPDETVVKKIVKVPDLNSAVKSVSVSSNNVVKDNIAVENAIPVIPASADKNLSQVMANKMVNGVPLPLAINSNIVGKIPTAEVKEDINKSKKVDDIENNKPMVRDILGENKNSVQEEREKRDLDTVVKMDETISDVKPKIVEELPGDKNYIQEKVISRKITNPVDEKISDLKKPDASGKSVIHADEKIGSNVVQESDRQEGKEKAESLVKILNKDDKANCPKPEKSRDTENSATIIKVDGKSDVGMKTVEDKQPPVPEHDLIKTVSYLSNPKVPEIDATNVKVGDPARNSIQDVKPMSRDLKSVQNTEDTRQQERASEIT